MKTLPICPHASAGCNYPEGECPGFCLPGGRTTEQAGDPPNSAMVAVVAVALIVCAAIFAQLLVLLAKGLGYL